MSSAAAVLLLEAAPPSLLLAPAPSARVVVLDALACVVPEARALIAARAILGKLCSMSAKSMEICVTPERPGADSIYKNLSAAIRGLNCVHGALDES